MTKIEWTNESWNPITGCSKISPGCVNCYAERMAKRFAGRFGYPKDDPFRVTFHEDRLSKPSSWKKPRMIFVCSMGDLFHEDVPLIDIQSVFYAMFKSRRHIYQILTKRPEIMAELLNRWFGSQLKNWPNIWLGTSAEDQEWLDRRLYHLSQIQAAVRFVSLEPLLGPIDLSGPLGLEWSDAGECWIDNREWVLSGRPRVLDWVIIGCESGPKRRECKFEWVWDIVGQCKAAHVPCFVKQLQIKGNYSWLYDNKVSHDPEEWPEDLRIREFPNGKTKAIKAD